MEKALDIVERIKDLRAGVVPLSTPEYLERLKKYPPYWRLSQATEGPELPIEDEPDAVWRAPEPLLGLRKTPVKSSHSEVNETPYFEKNATLGGSSALEGKVVIMLLALPGVDMIRSEYPALLWQDDEGETHTHYGDFYLRMKNGFRLVVAVKYERDEDKVPVDRIRAHPSFSKVADDIEVYTDADMKGGAYDNAWNIYMSRLCFDEAEHEATLADVSHRYGEFMFYDLLPKDEPPDLRFNAVWNLIDRRVLVASERGPIDHRSWLFVDRRALEREVADVEVSRRRLTNHRFSLRG